MRNAPKIVNTRNRNDKPVRDLCPVHANAHGKDINPLLHVFLQIFLSLLTDMSRSFIAIQLDRILFIQNLTFFLLRAFENLV